MNVYVRQEVQDFQDKMNGYLTLFNYRMMNFCVKADPVALLPVTVSFYDSEYNLEEVARIQKPNDFQLEVFPKSQAYLDEIAAGVFDVHPEFKVETITEKDSQGREEHHLLYTMPEVNKDRRDLLNNTVKTFYDECKAHLEECNTKYEAKFVEILSEQPSEFEAAKNAVSDIYHDAKKQAEKLYAAKLEEIEKGYKRYLEQEEKKQSEESQKFDFTKGMPLNYEE